MAAKDSGEKYNENICIVSTNPPPKIFISPKGKSL